jgi:hypothetical protein
LLSGEQVAGRGRGGHRVPPVFMRLRSVYPSETVCDRVAMVLGDELRDYRILFRWCIPAVEAFSRFAVVVICGLRLPVPRPGRRR